MRKPESIRYPNSANLFTFCRKVLHDRYGGMRVIDQDVGQLLEFDPADCSHWKNGKKNIRTIQAVQAIAKKLGIDEKLVLDVAFGEMDDKEAYLEFSGYGAWGIDPEIAEQTRKQLYRVHASEWSSEKENEIKMELTTKTDSILNIVNAIHSTLDYETAPLYLPELVSKFPYIEFEAVDADTKLSAPIEAEITDENCKLKFHKGKEVRPFFRFKIASMLGQSFLTRENLIPSVDLLGDEGAKYVADIRCNLFAAHLLAPDHLLRNELSNVNPSLDVINQLADAFWVSKKFMNKRMQLLLG